jgi:hypothetical protein
LRCCVSRTTTCTTRSWRPINTIRLAKIRYDYQLGPCTKLLCAGYSLVISSGQSR